MKTLTMIAAAVLLCSASSARAESTRRSTSTLSSTSAPKLLLGRRNGSLAQRVDEQPIVRDQSSEGADECVRCVQRRASVDA